MAKAALITFGNEESYGLEFVGGELLRHGQEIRFFDGESGTTKRLIEQWAPKFLMFSPLTTFLEKAKRFIKYMDGYIKVFGGHGVMADSTVAKYVDVVVQGPVRGSIQNILDGERGVIKTVPTTPDDMPAPARREYYDDIPRAAKRYRKFMMSMLGCNRNCSYCSSGHIRDMFGTKVHKQYYLQRRPIQDVLKELDVVMQYGTEEIEWVDDDIFIGDEDWMIEFIRHVKVPMYVSSCSASVLKASDRILEKMRSCVNVVGMGVQAIRPDTLDLYGRSWDNEDQMKEAYNRLVSFGYRVNLQAIVGPPIDDPVEDAIETILGLQRIGAGSICSVYPLMIYPGTKMETYCKENGYAFNEKYDGDTNSAICDVEFDICVTRQLKNICKLGTMLVKYNISEQWIRALVNMDFDSTTSEQLSMARYNECIVDRLGSKGQEMFNDIISSMKLRF